MCKFARINTFACIAVLLCVYECVFMSNERLNLTLDGLLWGEVDRFRGMKYQTRQEFIRVAVVEYVSALNRAEERESELNARLYSENQTLKLQLDNLQTDFRSVTGKIPRLRT